MSNPIHPAKVTFSKSMQEALAKASPDLQDLLKNIQAKPVPEPQPSPSETSAPRAPKFS